jgi:hypothetical protein
MKASSRLPNRRPRRHFPFPSEPRRPNAERGPDEETPPLRGRKGKACSRLSREDEDFREYYRLR